MVATEAERTEVIEENGVKFTLVRTTRGGWEHLTVLVDIHELRRLDQPPGFTRESRATWKVLDGETIVVDAPSFAWFKMEARLLLEGHNVESILAHCKEALAMLEGEERRLSSEDRPVNYLKALIADAKACAEELRWTDTPNFTKALSALNAARNQLDKLFVSPVEALIKELTCDYSPVHCHNRQVLERLEQFEIRSGGVLAVASEEWLLTEWYPFVLENARTLSDMHRLRKELKLSFDDLLPPERRNDPKLELAPQDLQSIGYKGRLYSWPVTYTYDNVDGRRVPTGRVTIACKVYNSLPAIPRLPHGIRLMVDLTVNKKVVVTGEAGGSLERRLDQYRKAERRRKAIDRSGKHRS